MPQSVSALINTERKPLALATVAYILQMPASLSQSPDPQSSTTLSLLPYSDLQKEFQPIITKFLGPLTRVQSESLAPIGRQGWAGGGLGIRCGPAGLHAAATVAGQGLAAVASSQCQAAAACTSPARPPVHHPPMWPALPCVSPALPDTAPTTHTTHQQQPTHPPTHPHHCDTVFLFPSIGNAPTLMSMEDMKRVIPVFFNMSIEVHNDEAATKEWGWVQASGCRRGVCREQAAFP